MRQFSLALAGAVLLLAATVGFSAAQSVPSSNDKKQQHEAVINLAASKLGLTGDQLSSALKQARKDLGLGTTGLKGLKLGRAELSVAAKTLGYADVKALRRDLKGTTLTALAQKHNVAPATVSSAIKADVDAKIQDLANAGKIKPERAAALKVKAEAKVDALMTRQFR